VHAAPALYAFECSPTRRSEWWRCLGDPATLLNAILQNSLLHVPFLLQSSGTLSGTGENFLRRRPHDYVDFVGLRGAVAVIIKPHRQLPDGVGVVDQSMFEGLPLSVVQYPFKHDQIVSDLLMDLRVRPLQLSGPFHNSPPRLVVRELSGVLLLRLLLLLLLRQPLRFSLIVFSIERVALLSCLAGRLAGFL
jgi:hypothetical protein